MVNILILILLLVQLVNGAFYPTQQILPFCVALLLAIFTVKRYTKAPVHPLALWGCALILYTLGECLTAPSLDNAIPPTALFLFYGIIGLAGLKLIRNEGQKLLVLILLLAFVNASLACLEEAFKSSTIPTIHGIVASCVQGRYNGTFLNPNYLGGFSVLGLSLTLLMTEQLSLRYKYAIAFIISCIFIEAVVASQSRSAILLCSLMLVALFVLALTRYQSKKLALHSLMGIIILTCSVLTHESTVKRIHQLAETSTKSASPIQGENQRIAYWTGTYKLWKTSPTFGIKPGMLNDLWPEVQPSTVQTYPFKAHNFVLQILCEYGLIGLVLLGGFLVCWVKYGYKSWCSVNLQATCAIGALILLTCDLVDYSLFEPLHGIAFVLLVCISLPSVELVTTKGKTIIISTVGVLSCIVLAFYVVTSLLTNSIKPSANPADAIHTYQSALFWKPYSSVLHLKLAKTLAEQQDAKKLALAEFYKAYNCNPYNQEAIANLAVAMVPFNTKVSQQLLNNLVKDAPNNYAAFAFAWQINAAMGKTAQAEECLKRSKLLEQNLMGGFQMQ